jgi:hypothetical protein
MKGPLNNYNYITLVLTRYIALLRDKKKEYALDRNIILQSFIDFFNNDPNLISITINYRNISESAFMCFFAQSSYLNLRHHSISWYYDLIQYDDELLCKSRGVFIKRIIESKVGQNPSDDDVRQIFLLVIPIYVVSSGQDGSNPQVMYYKNFERNPCGSYSILPNVYGHVKALVGTCVTKKNKDGLENLVDNILNISNLQSIDAREIHSCSFYKNTSFGLYNCISGYFESFTPYIFFITEQNLSRAIFPSPSEQQCIENPLQYRQLCNFASNIYKQLTMNKVNEIKTFRNRSSWEYTMNCIHENHKYTSTKSCFSGLTLNEIFNSKFTLHVKEDIFPYFGMYLFKDLVDMLAMHLYKMHGLSQQQQQQGDIVSIIESFFYH